MPFLQHLGLGMLSLSFSKNFTDERPRFDENLILTTQASGHYSSMKCSRLLTFLKMVHYLNALLIHMALPKAKVSTH